MPIAAWNLMTEARRSTPVFAMPAPESMAALESAPLHIYPATRALLQAEAPLTLQQVGAALAEWPTPRFDAAAAAEIDCHRAHDPHDAFFRIVRSDDAPVPALARAALQALQLFADETPLPDERADYAGLGDALAQVLAEALGQPQPLRTPPPAPAPQMRAAQPLRRWLRGHQVFAVLTQGLVRQLHRVVREVDSEGSDAALDDELQRMAALYRASALAFRFTADFEPAIYAETIRPSMCEPYTPKGFSGTLSGDHGVLVKLLVGRREPLATASRRCPQAYEAMRGAIAAVYDDHKHVCARFDGDRSPSLRTTSVKGDSTAVDMLDRFRTRRIAMLP